MDSRSMVKAMFKTDPQFVQVAKSLFGDTVDAEQVWAEVYKMSPTAPDVSPPRGFTPMPKQKQGLKKPKPLGPSTKTSSGKPKLAPKQPPKPKAATPKKTPTSSVMASKSLEPVSKGKLKVARAARKAARQQKRLASARQYSEAASEPLAENVTRAVGEGIAHGGRQTGEAAAEAARQIGRDFAANKTVRRVGTGAAVGTGVLGAAKVHGDVQRGRQASATNRLARANRQVAASNVYAANKMSSNKRHLEAVGKSEDVVWEGEISKTDDDKRLGFGWASVVSINGEPVVDRQGDAIEWEELEKSAYDYVMKSRKGGNMHKREGDAPFHAAEMIESFVVTPEKIEKMGLPQSTPVGWWVGYKVHDDDTWQSIKKGELTSFSIHGRGKRQEVTE